MRHLDPVHLDTAFVAPGTPMFDAVLREVECNVALPPGRRRDLASGLRRVAKVLGRAPSEVPADPRWLQPRLGRVLPARHGLSEKTWRNTVSNAKSALAAAGIVTRRSNRTADLMPEWQRLWRDVLASGDKSIQPGLRRFVNLLNRLSVPPDAVGPEHAIAYRDALIASEISKSPETAYRAAVNGWNLAVRRIPSWPRQVLPLPSRRKRIALPAGTLPASFAEDLEAFLGRLARPDPLDDTGPDAPLSPTTITHYRTKLLKFAGAAVRGGIPAETLLSLRDLVQPDVAEAGLRWLLAGTDQKTTRDLAQMSALLARVGRDHARLAKDQQARLETMAKRLRQPASHGMTPKNRDRLRAFEDPDTLRKLLQLPERLMARVPGKPAQHGQALLSEEAVAIALLLYCPIRRGNLARIRFDQNLQPFGDGRVFLVFEGHEVKNGRRIEFELPPALAAMIEAHRRHRVPLLCDAGTAWLFPARRTTGPVHAELLACRIKRRIEREIGVTMNVHLFRHLAAKIYLDANPGAYEVVRRLLGHAELSKTVSAYAGFEAGTATRLFATVLDRRRDG